jgi:hypothetical protein
MKSLYTLEERIQIETLISAGLSCVQIARELNRSADSIENEIQRGGGRAVYNGKALHERVLRNLSKRRKPLSEEQIAQIEKGISLGLGCYHIRKMAGCGTRRIFQYIKKHHPTYKSFVRTSEQYLTSRIDSLEMQVEILFEQIKELTNEKTNKCL